MEAVLMKVGIFVAGTYEVPFAVAGIASFLDDYVGSNDVDIKIVGPGASAVEKELRRSVWPGGSVHIPIQGLGETHQEVLVRSKVDAVLVVASNIGGLKDDLAISFGRSAVPLGLMSPVPFVKNRFWYTFLLEAGLYGSSLEWVELIRAAYRYRELEAEGASQLFTDGSQPEGLSEALRLVSQELEVRPLPSVEVFSSRETHSGGVIVGDSDGFCSLMEKAKEANFPDKPNARQVMTGMLRAILGLSRNTWRQHPEVLLGLNTPVFFAIRPMEPHLLRQHIQYIVRSGNRIYRRVNGLPSST
jgi:hypothetical protein